MKTFNDFEEVIALGDTDERRLEFVKSAIQDHKSSVEYHDAYIAEQYAKKKNVTIMEYVKLLYTLEGQAVVDYFSPNYKLRSGFFRRFIKQEKSFLLGNGVSWVKEDTETKLGTEKKPFDTQLQDLAEMALVGGVSFGFYNFDHIDAFRITEFAPLYDEEDGALKAGIRFWQVDETKPIRATLYEIDGYTDYIWHEKQREGNKEEYDSNGRVLNPKRKYKQVIKSSPADGDEILDGSNYPSFPIVPLWANDAKQSELVGLREQIDCYDLIKSGFANTVDEASIVYWLVQNAGGMDDLDLRKFIDRIKTVHAATTGDEEGATAEPHTINYDHSGREALLVRLANDLYKDAMALDVEQIANGAVTATQIEAAYEPLNEKADDFEFRILEFINGILELAGITDEKPTFTRSYIVNTTELITNLVQSATYLSEDYVTEKLLNLLGDGDKVDEVLEKIDEQALATFGTVTTPTEGGTETTDEASIEEVAEQATGKSLTVGQINSIVGIIQQFQQGTLTENQAVNIVSIALGISKEQAREIITT